jgi:type IV secretion system protein VirD4
MRNNHFLQGLQGFNALHQRSLEADYARQARERAHATAEAMAIARPSGRLGNGRTADIEDVVAAGLLNPEGLFLGAKNGKLLFYNGDGPLLTYLRVGGGKGRDYLLPNLAHVRSRSVVVTDLKDGENTFASAGHRSGPHFGPCIYVDPFGITGRKSTNVNPFQNLKDIAARGGVIDTEAKEAAQIYLPPPTKPGGDDWVRKGAIGAAAMRLEYLAHFEPELCRPSGLWCFANADHEETSTAFALMATCGIEAIERKAKALESIFDKVPKQYAAYSSDISDAFDAFESGKTLDVATSTHEFDFAALKHKPHTVFIILPAEKIGVAAAWVSAILNYLIEVIAKAQGPVRTTFLLDEFPQLPAAPAILKAVRVYRAMGIQPWFFAQGRFSMEGKWSRDAVKEFEDQAAIMTLKSVFEPDLLRDIELWSGNETILMNGVSHNGGTVETAAANLGEAKRAVLQSEDIIGLGGTKQIIRVSGMPRLLVADSVPFYDVEPWAHQIRDVRELHVGARP